MTIDRVNEYNDLKLRIRQLAEYIRNLEESAQPQSPDLSGASRSPSPKNKLDEIVPKIADASNEKDDCEKRLYEIECFFRSVGRKRIRSVIQYRYIDQLRWSEVAEKMGMSEDSVKALWYRVLKNSEK